MIEWEKMSNFAGFRNKSYTPTTPLGKILGLRVKQEHNRSVPPPFQVRFKSVPYIGER